MNHDHSQSFNSGISIRQSPSDPMEEWSSIPEFPLAAELNPPESSNSITAESQRYVLQNDVRYPYASKEQYLETHYRLNREEAIAFLRLGIAEYKRDPYMSDNENTFIYTRVFVQGYLMTRLGPVCRVQFSVERAGKRIRWSTSPRLTPGTLLALSTASDNFKSICKPAVVADRRLASGLEKSTPTVDIFWANVEDAVIDPMEELVMVESRRGFFEAMRHTLVGLQHVATCKNPILEYLINGNDVGVCPEDVVNRPYLDFTPLLHNLPQDPVQKARLLDTCRRCQTPQDIFNDVGPYTKLDSSQLQAVYSILRNTVAIIQGPPGTGKTYTSVQALKCMISTITSGTTKNPDGVIIVAAETNHAVDQMLSHFINSNINVVRLGGRTRNEKVKKCSLYNLRNKVMGSLDKDFNNLEATRKGMIREFKMALGEALPETILQPEALLQNNLINKDQFDSLAANDWTSQDIPGHPTGLLSEWLGSSLQRATIRPSWDAIFDDTGACDDAEDDSTATQMYSDTEGLSLNDEEEEEKDSSHLKGIWIGIHRNWAGFDPLKLPTESSLIKRQLKKTDLWDIDEKWRGPIYEHWSKYMLLKLQKDLLRILTKYTEVCNEIKRTRWEKDAKRVRSLNVYIVGCTTTGLSKYRGLLSALEPKVLLIEEAAQSREASIAAAILPSLQQLILVGDHQQLVPYCAVPGLADSYHNLTVSMFERFVEYLHLPCTVLNQQRRMTPDIRTTLNPFYPNLGDHPTVLDREHLPDIPGMQVNSYLFNHNWPEGTDISTHSKYNEFEAEMVVRFAMYLMQNGINASQITILTFYRGQRKKILGYARRHLTGMHSDINVATVDSYQGEENDVVLLSLVRSTTYNRSRSVGFVGDMNRGVVAISRARRGLYIFGNMQTLETASDTSKFMWSNVHGYRFVAEIMGRSHTRRILKASKVEQEDAGRSAQMSFSLVAINANANAIQCRMIIFSASILVSEHFHVGMGAAEFVVWNATVSRNVPIPLVKSLKYQQRRVPMVACFTSLLN